MKIKLIAVVMVVAMSTGCVHKSGTSVPVTPWEKATTDDAILAQGIDTLEQGAEAAVNSGLLSKSVGGQIIGLCGQAATVQLEANKILATAPNVSGSDLSTVETLISQVGDSAMALINSGQIGIKNPKSQQLFSTDVQAVVNIANMVIADIQAAEGASK
jgi:hypothetical protein